MHVKRVARKCYILHAICSLILMLDFNSKQISKLENKVPKPENKVAKSEIKVPKLDKKVPKLENKVSKAENKVLQDIREMCYIRYCKVQNRNHNYILPSDMKALYKTLFYLATKLSLMMN